MKRIALIFVVITFCILQAGCKKYLDVKSVSSLTLPKTLEDFQALLDSYERINYRSISAGFISCDDLYLTDADYNALSTDFRRTYTWESDNLFTSSENDWSITYNKVYTMNIILDNIDKSEAVNTAEKNDIRGQALFARAYSLFNLVITFSPPYRKQSEGTDLGIPLRLSSDINEKITRPTLKATFEKIIADTKEAATLMGNTPKHILRGSKPAAYALLARIFLYQKDYENCYKYADLCLKLKNTLISFNSPDIPDIDAPFPFNTSTLLYNNPEIIYGSRIDNNAIQLLFRAKVDSTLYSLYEADDNRKKVLFSQDASTSVVTFKGSYEGNGYMLFDGLATDEIYFMRSEAAAHMNRISESMSDLNAVISKRWDKNTTYTEITAGNSEDALQKILKERRKSLVFRGLRWMDIKRLNSEGGNIVLSRKIAGSITHLQPNDLRYAISIPESIINYSGIPQNPR